MTNVVATNIRFPVDEYEQIKLLSLVQKQSAASIIRAAVKNYTQKKLTSKTRVSIAEKLRLLSVKIDVPVLDLIKEGRKFA